MIVYQVNRRDPRWPARIELPWPDRATAVMADGTCIPFRDLDDVLETYSIPRDAIHVVDDVKGEFW